MGRIVYHLNNPKHTVDIALVGKYVELKDSYKSISESFIHTGSFSRCKVNLHWICSEKLDADSAIESLKNMDGVLVAPGFGLEVLKVNFMLFSMQENNIPFFGICLGMQASVIEYARNVLDYDSAHSTEMNPESSYPVIDIMEEQKKVTNMGGTMRLGSCACELKRVLLLMLSMVRRIDDDIVIVTNSIICI